MSEEVSQILDRLQHVNEALYERSAIRGVPFVGQTAAENLALLDMLKRKLSEDL